MSVSSSWPGARGPVVRPGRSLAATALGLGLLALVAVMYVRQFTAPAPAGGTVTAATAFRVLGRAQERADALPGPAIRFMVRPGTTRYLADTPSGRHYLAVGLTGEACLLTVLAGAPPQSSCAAVPADPAQPVLVRTDPAHGEDVALVADGYQPTGRWRAVTTNLVSRAG